MRSSPRICGRIAQNGEIWKVVSNPVRVALLGNGGRFIHLPSDYTIRLGQFENRIRKGKLSRIFFPHVLLFTKFLIAFCTFPMLAETASTEAATQGFMEGHLKIVWMRAVERSDEMPRSEVVPESYAQYPLIILTEKEKKEVSRVTADESGNYRVALTPGAYILDVQDRRAKRIHANPQSFTVTANQTVRVDLSIFIGFAKGQASVSSN